MPHFADCNPTWTDIVETEREIMNFYGWDIGFVLPIHYIEMFLANGILFESEKNSNSKIDKSTAERLELRCFEILDEMTR